MYGQRMKRKNNLYDEILDIKKIKYIYDKQIRINTKNKEKIEKFENNYVSNIKNIKDVLEQKNYIPDKYNIFLIREPKVRLIMAQNIKDKTINHIVSKYFLTDIFESTLINENVATRKNKGTHYGIKLIKKYLNEIKGKEFYILKYDIKKYFFNIDHEILKKIIRKKIKDKEVLKILDTIIDSTDKEYINEEIKKIKVKEIPYYKKGKGLSIGNMTSQVMAIMYLNELDQFIHNKLKIKYYIRYNDDGIIFHENKEYLKYCLKEIKKIIKKYELELNSKTSIISSKNGFNFLGFHYYIKNNKIIMKVSTQTKKKFKRKMKSLKGKKLEQVKVSYLGHLKYGSSKGLIYNTLKEKNIKVYFVKIIDNTLVKEGITIKY